MRKDLPDIKNARPVEHEDFVELDRRDEAQIVRELTGELVEEYAYSFYQGNRLVVGLSYAGVKAAAQQMGNITVSEPKIQETEEYWTAYCSATDKTNGITFWGGAQQAKLLPNGNPDPFAFAKVISKAQRNAIRALLPETIIQMVIRKYLESAGSRRQETGGRRPEMGNGSPAAIERRTADGGQRTLPNGNGDTPLDRARKRCFALIQKYGFDGEAIAQFLRDFFGVESRKDMKEEDWERAWRLIEILHKIDQRKLDEETALKVMAEAKGKNDPRELTVEDLDGLREDVKHPFFWDIIEKEVSSRTSQEDEDEVPF